MNAESLSTYNSVVATFARRNSVTLEMFETKVFILTEKTRY